MCWSEPVSWGFALAQGVGIARLVQRKQGRDFWFALVALPIMGQEVLQALVWRELGMHGASATQCSMANRRYTLLLRLMVGLVPLFGTIFAVYGADDRSVRKARGARVLLGLATTYVLSRSAWQVAGCWLGPPACTVVGPMGHQDWGDPSTYLISDAIWPIFLGIYVGLPAISLLVYFRPRWLGMLLLGYSVVTLSVSLWWFGAEGESVWCWSCAMLLALGWWEGGRERQPIP